MIPNRLKHIFLKRHPQDLPLRERRWLTALNIHTFIDIGSYVGEYIDYARILFPEAAIFAFEPLEDCYRNLVKKTSGMPEVTVYNFALGDKNTSTVIHRSSYAPSSSLLPMANLHKTTFPFSSGSTKEDIRIRTLDSVLAKTKLRPNIFIKIDTQGYEDKVIRGGKRVISQAAGLQIEVSFATLYHTQPLFHEIYSQLHSLGFVFHGVHNQILSPDDGYILQAHAYFIHKKYLTRFRHAA